MKEEKNVCSGDHRGDGGTSCVFSFLFITSIYLREIHVPPCILATMTEVRGQPEETGSPFYYHGLQGSNSGHQPWQQVPELLAISGPLQDSCHGVSVLPPGCSLSIHLPLPEFTA